MKRQNTGDLSLPSASQKEHHALPNAFILDELREKRHFRFLARKLGSYLAYCVIYLMILAMQRDVNRGFLLHTTIDKEILTTSNENDVSFNDITSIGDTWSWLERTLVPSVYLRNTNERHTIGTQTSLVGGFRLLQRRRKNDTSPCYDSIFDSFVPICVSDVSEVDDEPFGNGSLLAFTFTTDNTSSVSGYQHAFSYSNTSGESEINFLKQMKDGNWIDHMTKDVMIDMTLYNHNMKLWVGVRMTIYFDLAGGVSVDQTTRVFSIDPYNLASNWHLARMVLEFTFVILVAYFILLEAYDFCIIASFNLTAYNARYGVLNNLGDLLHILLSASILFLWVEFFFHPIRASLLGTTDFSNYIDIVPLAEWEARYMSLNTINVLFQTLRGLKYFQITEGGLRLIRSLLEAGPEIASFLPIFVTVLAGYTFAGHFLYGLTHEEWSTWDGAFFRVYEMNFGLYDPNEIYDAGGAVSAFFIYTGTVVICIVMLNVFLAIVMTTWDAISDEMRAMKERDDLQLPQMSYNAMLRLAYLNEDRMEDIVACGRKMDKNGFMTHQEFLEFFKKYGVGITPELVTEAASWFWKPTMQDSTKALLASVRKAKVIASSKVMAAAAVNEKVEQKFKETKAAIESKVPVVQSQFSNAVTRINHGKAMEDDDAHTTTSNLRKKNVKPPSKAYQAAAAAATNTAAESSPNRVDSSNDVKVVDLNK